MFDFVVSKYSFAIIQLSSFVSTPVFSTCSRSALDFLPAATRISSAVTSTCSPFFVFSAMAYFSPFFSPTSTTLWLVFYIHSVGEVFFENV